jgi:hypothetical protein
MQEHGRDPGNAPRYAEVAGIVDIARIERRPVNRLVAVWQLVEKPHRKVRDDQRDVDDRNPPGPNAIGDRDHASRLLGGAADVDTAGRLVIKESVD